MNPRMFTSWGGLALVLGGWIFAAWHADRTVARWLEEDFDQHLLLQSKALIQAAQWTDRGLEIRPTDLGISGGYGLRFQLWDHTGSTIMQSDLEGSPSPRDLPRLLPTEARMPVVRWQDGPAVDSTPRRMVQVDFVPSSTSTTSVAPMATLVVSAERSPLDQRLRTLHWTIGGSILAGLASVAWVVGWGMGPSRRSTANLERIEDAALRERRLSSNIAHELRTPIAELRSLAEVAQRQPDDRESVLEFFTDARDIAIQMEGIVVNLLSLARSESGLERVSRESIRLAELVDLVWRPLARDATQKQLKVALDIAPSLVVHSDPVKLQLILANILGNAVAHSPMGSEVSCSAEQRPDAVMFTVSNAAPQLTREDLPRLFDRFWRKDSARTSGRHAGLGLALVGAFAELLGIDIDTELRCHEGSGQARLTLTLGIPSEPPGRGSADSV